MQVKDGDAIATSPFYEMEIEAIKKRGYTNIELMYWPGSLGSR